MESSLVAIFDTECIYPVVNKEPSWSRYYDFTRRIATVVRFSISLKLVTSKQCLGKIIKLLAWKSIMKITSLEIHSKGSGPWLTLICMLLPHFHLENKIKNQRENRFDITEEMIVVDYDIEEITSKVKSLAT